MIQPTISMLGMDPEVFIWNTTSQSYVPAHKRNFNHKTFIEMEGSGGFIRDGYAIEFNPHAVNCRYVLSARLYSLLASIQRTKLLKDDAVVARSTIEIDFDTLEDAPGDVSEFGCESAWNAYSEGLEKPDIDGRTHPYRYAGCHFHHSIIENYKVHYEWANNPSDVFLWAKLADKYVGLLGTYLVGSDLSTLRRRYYGQAGEFRYQSHDGYAAALEYRTLGSEILSHPALLSLMLGLSRHVFDNVPTLKTMYDPTYQKQVQAIINQGTSHDSILDLIPEMPGWYSKKLLRIARREFSATMHNDLLDQAASWAVETSLKSGWAEWCKTKGFNHWRTDYRSNDTILDPIEVQNLTVLNTVWEGETA